MISRTALMLSTAFAALAVPGIAAAQETAVAATAETATAEASQDPAAAEADDGEDHVIVVTAQKRAQDAHRSSAVDLRRRRRNAGAAAGDQLRRII